MCGHRFESADAVAHRVGRRAKASPIDSVALQLLSVSLLAVGLTFLGFIVVRTSAPEWLKSFLFPGGALNVVPLAILGLFVDGALLSLLLAVRQNTLTGTIGRLRGALAQRAGRSASLNQASEDLRAPGLVLQAIQIIGRAWEEGRDYGETKLVAERQVEAQAQRSETCGAVVKLFVWAIPLLGFIGTVVGITLAVGEFSSFLGGNIEDIGEIQKRLVTVTEGLAFAFNTTLIGLACALVLMLFSFLAGHSERRYLFELDALLTEEVLFFIRRAPSPENAARQAAAAPRMQE